MEDHDLITTPPVSHLGDAGRITDAEPVSGRSCPRFSIAVSADLISSEGL
jgi:hypothetical protein